MAGLGSIGSAAIGRAGLAVLPWHYHFFNLGGVFDKDLPLPARFDKLVYKDAVFDKSRAIDITVAIEG